VPVWMIFRCKFVAVFQLLFIGYAVAFDINEIKANWAVLVGSSRYYFNYRHYANLLSIRNVILKLGIPASNIIVLNAGFFSNDPRNPVKGDIVGYGKDDDNSKILKRQFLLKSDSPFLYQHEEDVSVESLSSLLTGRTQHISLHSSPNLSPSSYSPLQSDEESSVLLYLSGHGGDGFFKFHDSQELSAEFLADTIREMHLRGRFKRMLVVADTCKPVCPSN